MDTIAIGKSGIRAGRIAFGCWRVAGFCNLPEHAAEHAAQGRKAILAAYEAGYTLFDHADIYGAGEAERLFGQVLKEVPEMRSRIQIMSKAGIRLPGNPAAGSPYRYDSSPGHIIFSCEQSLQRLGVETLDFYLIHRPDFLCDPEQLAEAFSRLKQSGKVREFGVSNFAPYQVADLQRVCPMPLAVNQVEISLDKRDRLHDGTLEQCTALGSTPMAWSPLAGGRLASADPIALDDPDHARRIHLREALDLVAREHGSTRPTVAIAWLLKHPANILPIIGSSNPDRIRELGKAVDLHLSREEWYQLLEASMGQRLP